MRLTSASVRSGGPATSRSIAATARSGSRWGSPFAGSARVASVAGATSESGSDRVARALSAVGGGLACRRASDRELECGFVPFILRVECRPPRAGLEGLGTFSADKFGKPGFPRARGRGVAVRSGQEAGVEVAADPPPQCRCSMIIRQRPAVDCRTQELSGVDPSTRDYGQPPGQSRCETVVPYRRCELFDQRFPLPPCGCHAVSHLLVEAALPHPGRLLSLNRTSGTPSSGLTAIAARQTSMSSTSWSGGWPATGPAHSGR